MITIETHQQTLIRSRRKILVTWCDQCGKKTLMLLPAEAAILGGATERVIFRQIENGDLHFIEGNKGELLVCSNALELSQK